MRNEELDVSPDKRPVSPYAERNKGPIADVLKRILPDHGTVLEISSGALADSVWRKIGRGGRSRQSDV